MTEISISHPCGTRIGFMNHVSTSSRVLYWDFSKLNVTSAGGEHHALGFIWTESKNCLGLIPKFKWTNQWWDQSNLSSLVEALKSNCQACLLSIVLHQGNRKVFYDVAWLLALFNRKRNERIPNTNVCQNHALALAGSTLLASFHA